MIFFLASQLPLLLGAWCMARRWGGGAQRPIEAVDLVLSAQIYFAVLVGVGLLLGVSGLLMRPVAGAAAVLVGLAMLAYGRNCLSLSFERPRRRWGLTASRLILFFVVLSTAWRAVTMPEYDYDVLTYHLTFPAQWIQNGAISILPTWFGDPSPSYAPCANEVFYTWLLLPLGSDSIARAGQFPFWLLLLAAVAGIGRELRLRRAERTWLCIAVATIPAIAAQSCTAMVDVAVAAHVLTIVLFSLRLARRGRWSDFVGLVLGCGLLVGTKYLSTVYLATLIPLIIWAIARGGRGRWTACQRGWVATGAVLSLWVGGYAYARNWVVTGNPVYPVEVRIGSSVLFHGVYSREAMENSVFNIRRIGDPGGFGWTLWSALHTRPATDENAKKWYLLPGGPAIVLLFFGMLVPNRRRIRIGRLLFVATTIAIFVVYWYALPFQQGRFAWAPILLTLCGAAGASRLHRRAPMVVGLSLISIWIVVFGREWAEVWPTSGVFWLTTGISLAGLALMEKRPSYQGWRPAIGVGFTAVLLNTAFDPSGDERASNMALPRWRYVAEAWRWIDQRCHGTTIAYCGNNLPYFLYGRQLENHVCYVSTCHPLHGHYHDYAALPEVCRLDQPNTSEPVLARVIMDPAIWLENAKALGVEYVWVNSMLLSPNLLINVRHDEFGYPVERRWLDTWARSKDGAAPFAERLIFNDGAVLLYRLHWDRPVSTKGMTPIVRDEIDALDRLQRDRPPPGTAIRDYPLARSYIERNGLRCISSTGPP